MKAIIKIIEMKRMRMIGMLAVAGTIAVAGCGGAEADATDGAGTAAEFVRVINVETQRVVPQSFVDDIRLTSAVLANQDVMVAAEESGVIRELFVDKGRRVSEGDPIARIDDRLLSAQFEQAQAAASLASQTWERRKRLWEDDQVGSEIAYLESKYAAEQNAANARALEERLARTVIRAPFSGMIEERHVEIGSMVNPGQSVVRLVDLNPVKVVAGEIFSAPIHYVGSTVEASTRTFMIEVIVANDEGMIKPQMVANMSVTRRQVVDAVVVPQDALVRVEKGYVAFVVSEWNEGTVAEVRPVMLGPTRNNLVVIEEGIEAGELLVVVGQKSVADGDRVNVVRERE